MSDGLELRPKYKGIVHCLTTIWKLDGLRGLYQGVTPNVWGAGLSWGLYFFLWVDLGDFTILNKRSLFFQWFFTFLSMKQGESSVSLNRKVQKEQKAYFLLCQLLSEAFGLEEKFLIGRRWRMSGRKALTEATSVRWIQEDALPKSFWSVRKLESRRGQVLGPS